MKSKAEKVSVPAFVENVPTYSHIFFLLHCADSRQPTRPFPYFAAPLPDSMIVFLPALDLSHQDFPGCYHFPFYVIAHDCTCNRITAKLERSERRSFPQGSLEPFGTRRKNEITDWRDGLCRAIGFELATPLLAWRYNQQSGFLDRQR